VILTGENGVWSIGGMILTGEIGLLEEKCVFTTWFSTV
jgi:hypothetical protein